MDVVRHFLRDEETQEDKPFFLEWKAALISGRWDEAA